VIQAAVNLAASATSPADLLSRVVAERQASAGKQEAGKY
jgi:hypothetical protein